MAGFANLQMLGLGQVASGNYDKLQIRRQERKKGGPFSNRPLECDMNRRFLHILLTCSAIAPAPPWRANAQVELMGAL